MAPALDSRLPRHARPPPGTPASKPTPRARPTPAPRTRGHNCGQTPRAGHSETHLPRMRYTINGGVFGRLPGKWGDRAAGPRGWGRRTRAEGGPARKQSQGLRGLPSRDLSCGPHLASALGQSFRSESPGSCLVLFF